MLQAELKQKRGVQIKKLPLQKPQKKEKLKLLRIKKASCYCMRLLQKEDENIGCQQEAKAEAKRIADAKAVG